MGRGDLTDKQWERLEPHLPPKKPKRGRPNTDHRRIINGILWIDRTGAPWRDLPERYGPWRTVASRFYRWRKAGVWERVLKALQRRKEAQGESSIGISTTWTRPSCGLTSTQLGQKGGPRHRSVRLLPRRFFDEGAYKSRRRRQADGLRAYWRTAQRDGRLRAAHGARRGQAGGPRASEGASSSYMRRQRLRQGGHSTLPQAPGHQDHHSTQSQRAP